MRDVFCVSYVKTEDKTILDTALTLAEMCSEI